MAVTDSGVIHIRSSFRSVILTATDAEDEPIAWAQSADVMFSEFEPAVQKAAETLAKTVIERGIKTVRVIVKGPGKGRELAIRTLKDAGLEVSSIVDTTPIPHNGCRPKRNMKRRAIM